jgi:hypothetical protein
MFIDLTDEKELQYTESNGFLKFWFRNTMQQK